jgi:hypothetical protein
MPQGQDCLIAFPYAPGDRVNLNFGMTVFKTKKMGMFSTETVTSPVGNAPLHCPSSLVESYLDHLASPAMSVNFGMVFQLRLVEAKEMDFLYFLQ